MTRQHQPVLPNRAPRFALRTRQPAAHRSPTPRIPRPGTVSGAWWPYTTDLIAELAGLETLLAGRASNVDRIMYDLDAWQPAPARTMVAGHSIRLDGYRHLPAHTLCVLGLDRTRRVLLVIPPGTETATAQALLSAASRPGNDRTAGELMAAERRRHDRNLNDAALSRWDSEGGRCAPWVSEAAAFTASSADGPTRHRTARWPEMTQHRKSHETTQHRRTPEATQHRLPETAPHRRLHETTQTPPQRRGAADRGPGRFGGGQPFATPTRTPRLRLRDRAEQAADLDGAWWPRTGNLTTELHDLVTALTARTGATTRITFDWNSLSRSQRGIDPSDGIEVTGPLPGQPPDVMYVFGPDDRPLRLRVIDPATDPAHAEAQIRAAVSTTLERPQL